VSSTTRTEAQRQLLRRALYVAAGVAAIGVIQTLARKSAARAASTPASTPDRGPMPVVPHTLSTAEIEAMFGPLPWQPVPGDDSAIHIDPAWTADHLVTVEIPQLRVVAGAPPDQRVTFHRDAAPSLVALFAAWEAAGLLDRVRSWEGSFAPRRIRGGKTVSHHAYGVAFDINARWNPLGAAPAPLGAPGSVRELVPLANAHGFMWGGAWSSRPDGMHFEAFRK